MLYLISGANGAGKTLNGLKWCKELADQTGRPVAYNGRFALRPDGPLANWKKIDAKDWESEPDGTIFFFDECQLDFPLRGSKDAPPQYVAALTEHRRRGFDFFLITQHPMNVDNYVRRLVGAPGYHRHLKRLAGASSMVSVLEWSAVNPQCEKPGSGDSGQVKTIPFPKEVYTWYDSAMLHTGKVSIPKAVYVVVAAVILVPVLGWYAFSKVMAPKDIAKTAGGATAQAAPAGDGGSARAVSGPLSAGEYVALRAPRINGLPYTAPAYDELTKPQDAPYPAACLEGRRPGAKATSCDCFTQQGTRLQTPKELCEQIVRNGFFLEWKAAPADVAKDRQPASREPARVDPAPESQMAVVPYTRPAPMVVTAPPAPAKPT